MFMIDKPFFMGFELSVASAVFLIWTYHVKPYEIWQGTYETYCFMRLFYVIPRESVVCFTMN